MRITPNEQLTPAERMKRLMDDPGLDPKIRETISAFSGASQGVAASAIAAMEILVHIEGCSICRDQGVTKCQKCCEAVRKVSQLAGTIIGMMDAFGIKAKGK